MEKQRSLMTDKFNIKVSRTRKNGDGTTSLTFKMTPHFQEWFCFFHGIEEWDQKVFEKWMLKTLGEYVGTENETSNDSGRE